MIRELETNDIYAMSNILEKMNLKINATEEKTQKQVGAEFILMVFTSLHLAKDEVNNFMGSLAGMTGEEFGKLPLKKSFEIIQEFKKIPDLLSFFKQASQ